eukprot:11889419-Heterocapsa_arctica.AAC.1
MAPDHVEVADEAADAEQHGFATMRRCGEKAKRAFCWYMIQKRPAGTRSVMMYVRTKSLRQSPKILCTPLDRKDCGLMCSLKAGNAAIDQ